MAKTIYEMAVAYATEDGEDGKPIVIKCEKDAFIFGANAVLEEIESCLGEFYSPDDYTNVKNKIKELKGESLR